MDFSLNMDALKERKETPEVFSDTFVQSKVSLRLGFIRKVYGILSAQLLLTTAVGGLFMYNESAKAFVQSSPNLLYLGCFASFGLIIALHIYKNQTPINFYLLSAFTLVEAYTVGFIVTLYDSAVVLQAFGLTMATVIALTVYTFQSKRDFSSWKAGLFSMLWILILCSFMTMFFQVEAVQTVMAGVGALLFAGFIIFDTHMLMEKLSPEEYIIGAINLYLDILNLFLEILKLMAKNNKN